jgi:hypothetical protein
MKVRIDGRRRIVRKVSAGLYRCGQREEAESGMEGTHESQPPLGASVLMRRLRVRRPEWTVSEEAISLRRMV